MINQPNEELDGVISKASFLISFRSLNKYFSKYFKMIITQINLPVHL